MGVVGVDGVDESAVDADDVLEGIAVLMCSSEAQGEGSRSAIEQSSLLSDALPWMYKDR